MSSTFKICIRGAVGVFNAPDMHLGCGAVSNALDMH